jgi:hypothetical protein
MDVDYVIIKYPDGREVLIFVAGWGTPLNPDNTPQLTRIDKNGKVHATGPVYHSGDIFSLLWMWGIPAALERPAPKNRRPVKGPYKGPKSGFEGGYSGGGYTGGGGGSWGGAPGTGGGRSWGKPRTGGGGSW